MLHGYAPALRANDHLLRPGRDIHGVLLLDKPAGITSNDILQRVKRLYGARKVGHTGSLDKTATGLLPLCFGDATKFSGYLLNADKHYRAICKLGAETTTGDAAGEIVKEMPVPKLDERQVEKVLAEFQGDIQQVPPMYSALKHKGQRLYELAYQGIEVERPARPVTIHRLQLLSLEKSHFEIEVRCSKGTYIRTLAEPSARIIQICREPLRDEKKATPESSGENAGADPSVNSRSSRPSLLTM